MNGPIISPHVCLVQLVVMLGICLTAVACDRGGTLYLICRLLVYDYAAGAETGSMHIV